MSIATDVEVSESKRRIDALEAAVTRLAETVEALSNTIAAVDRGDTMKSREVKEFNRAHAR